jgi:hypothetical protein
MLLNSGVTAEMIRTQLASGRLVRVRRGVFLDASCWPADPAGQHLVLARAELAVHPEAVLSHETAALAGGLPHPGFTPWHDAVPSVTLPAETGAKSRTGRVRHHTSTFSAGQVTRDADGYAITSVALTAVHVAAGLDVPQALVVLDSAARMLCAGMVAQPRRADYSNPRLAKAARELLSEAAGDRRRACLGEAIELADPARESPAESLSAGYIHRAGLPMPLFQQPIRTPLGTVYPDCLWPDARLVGECDGAEKYEDRSAAVREKQREQALRDLDYRIVRWLAAEIMTRAQVVMDRIARKLGL